MNDQIQQKDLVSYDLAMLLCESGYREPTYQYYTRDYYGDIDLHRSNTPYNWNPSMTDKISAPLYSEVMAWLREKFSIFLEITVAKVGGAHKTMYCWTPIIIGEHCLDYPITHPDGSIFGGFTDAYTRAHEEGITWILKNLPLRSK